MRLVPAALRLPLVTPASTVFACCPTRRVEIDETTESESQSVPSTKHTGSTSAPTARVVRPTNSEVDDEAKVDCACHLDATKAHLDVGPLPHQATVPNLAPLRPVRASLGMLHIVPTRLDMSTRPSHVLNTLTDIALHIAR